MAKDYAADAVPRLAGQFYESAKLTAMIKAIVDPLSVMEDTCDDMTTERWIDTAIGRQLDGCGYIVGVYRRGMTDDEYRVAIKFKVFVNVSNATPTDLIRGLKYLTSPTDCQYLEAWPATAILFSNGLFVPPNIHPIMQDLSPAAISDVPVCVSFAGKPFRFSRDIQTNPFGELFVNGASEYLEVSASDLLVTFQSIVETGREYSTLGGVAPADLFVSDMLLDVGGPTLAVYSPNHLQTLGHDNLTGVYQA